MADKHPMYDFESAPTKMFTYPVDTCPAGFIKYIGASQSCIIKCLATSNDITSDIGVLGSEAADPNFQLPAGGSAGLINVGETVANTIGKIADFVNSLDDYIFIPWQALRADSSDAVFLEEASGTQAKSASYNVKAGCPIYWDTDVALHHGIVISNMRFKPGVGPGGIGDEEVYDEEGAINKLAYFSIDPTFTGAVTCKLYTILGKVETEEASFVCAATTVPTTIPFKDTYGLPYVAPAGSRILVRFTAATTLTDATTGLVAMGQSVPKFA